MAENISLVLEIDATFGNWLEELSPYRYCQEEME